MRLTPPVTGQNIAVCTCVSYTSAKEPPGAEVALQESWHCQGYAASLEPHLARSFMLQASPAKSPFASAVPRCPCSFTVCWWCDDYCVKLHKNLKQGQESISVSLWKDPCVLDQSHQMGPQPLGLFCSCRRRWGPKSFMENMLLRDHFWRLLMYSSPLF